MNILLVTSPVVDLTTPFAGGTESFVVQLGNALVRRGHSVDVICKAADETNLFNTVSLSESAVRMCDDVTSEPEGQKQYQAAQFGLIDTGDYDAVHYHSYYHAIYEYASLHERSNIVTLHTPATPRLSVVHTLNRQRGDDIYVAVSSRLKDQWEGVTGPGISVISNGVDTNYFCPQQQDIKRDFLLWCGRLCHEKGAHEAITIARALRKPLMIAGPCADTEYYQHYIERELDENIHYCGHLNSSELKALYQQATALLATSLWEEPFGLASLEALACGTPVIGFKTAVPEELRYDNGVFLIEKHEPQTWVTALEHCSKIDVAALLQFAQGFSFSSTVDGYEALYARVSE